MPISVIIPVFNRPNEILCSVNSVMSQSHAVDELIIVDDGSTDNTATVISDLQLTYPSIIKIITQTNKGVSAARNAGINLAKGEWLAFLDSDDEWLPNKISTFLEHIKEQTDCQLFHSEEIWIRHGVRVNAMKKHKKRGGLIYQHCLPLCVISPSACVIKKSLLTDVGLFDENLPACEDYDLWLRICHNTPVCFSEEPLIKKYGGHDDQLSAKYWGMDRFRIIALDNLLNKNRLNTDDKFATTNMLCKKTKILLKGAKKHNNVAIISEFTPLLEKYECV